MGGHGLVADENMKNKKTYYANKRQVAGAHQVTAFSKKKTHYQARRLHASGGARCIL